MSRQGLPAMVSLDRTSLALLPVSCENLSSNQAGKRSGSGEDVCACRVQGRKNVSLSRMIGFHGRQPATNARLRVLREGRRGNSAMISLVRWS